MIELFNHNQRGQLNTRFAAGPQPGTPRQIRQTDRPTAQHPPNPGSLLTQIATTRKNCGTGIIFSTAPQFHVSQKTAPQRGLLLAAFGFLSSLALLFVGHLALETGR